jgi:cation diffusion facilitator CzcD-associated flavoprotein CzcO
MPDTPASLGTVDPGTVDIVIVGAGFAGLAMAIKLKQAGMPSFVVIEKSGEVGGTWRDNHYPGAACDIPSHLYSLSFEPKTDWSRMYPGHAELQDYLKGITDKHGLRPHIRFNTAVRGAVYDEKTCLWQVELDGGGTITARVVISAIGALHEPSIPRLPGIETFQGKTFHSAAWDHDCDLSGKRIAVVGTGASAIQFVPRIAPVVSELYVFQRTAPWINPKKDYPITARRQWLMKTIPFYRRLLRWRLFWLHEVRVLGFMGHFKVMKLAEGFANSYRERKIADPVLRAKLTPDYLLGCKRVLISNDYYRAVARENVDLVTSGIAEVKADQIVTVDGKARAVDAIIYGTGFKAADTARYGRIKGAGGVELADVWAQGGRVFWGVAMTGFPNYFMLLGPNTGLGHNSVVIMIEAQVRYIMSALKQMRRRKIRAIDVLPQSAAQFADMLEKRMAKTVWQRGGCQSWYQDEQGRNTTMWPGSVVEYVLRTRAASLADFSLTPESAFRG